MANIVGVIGSYYPNFSANGQIMKNIVDVLKKEHDVKVIATKNNFGLANTCQYEGYEIERVTDKATSFHNYCVKKKHEASNTFVRSYYNICLQIKRGLMLIKKTFRSASIDKGLVKKYINQLEKVNADFPIDVIIPISLPYEGIVASIEFKKSHNNVKVIPYQLDHFSESNTLHNFEFLKQIRYNRHINIEKHCVENADHFFILPQLKDHYSKSEFKSFQDKITVLEHPLLNEKNIVSVKENIPMDNFITLTYTGTLMKDKRNPSYLLDMLKLTDRNEKICLNLYHMGDCDDLINSYKSDLGDRLQNHGRVTLDKAFAAMNKADILINMGVTDGNQVSGKIFDYFSLGKPIVHLYFFDEDPNLVYLKDYPLSLCLKIEKDKVDQNAKLLIDFCKDNRGKLLKFEEVKEIFYYATPDYVASEFLNKI